MIPNKYTFFEFGIFGKTAYTSSLTKENGQYWLTFFNKESQSVGSRCFESIARVEAALDFMHISAYDETGEEHYRTSTRLAAPK